MIEQDLNDSFPESEFTTWNCPTCGSEQEILIHLLESTECPQCENALMAMIDTDWFDLIDPVERDAA
jgi:ribosomal protein S27E